MESTVDYGAISPAMIERVEDAMRATDAATRAWFDAEGGPENICDARRRKMYAQRAEAEAWDEIVDGAP